MPIGEVDADSGARTASREHVMYELDLTTGELQWSDAFYTVLQYPKTQPLNRQEWWIEHIHPDDAMLLNHALDKLLVPSDPGWAITYRFRRGDGNYIAVRDSASILRDAQGNAVSIIGTLAPVNP